MASYPPNYKVGDFVKCRYDFYDFYSYVYGENDYHFMQYYGIIVNSAWENNWDEIETVYKVYCMDGQFRFFLEDEIRYV